MTMLDPEPGDAASVLMAIVDLADRYADHIATLPYTEYERGRETSWRQLAIWIREGQFDPERVAAGTDIASTIH